MDDLRDTLDDVREAEEVKHRGLRLLVTTLILAVTVLGVVSAFFAARSDSRAVHSQTSQERESLAAQQQLARASAYGSLASDERNLAAVDLSFGIHTASADGNVARTWLQRSDTLTTNAAADGQLSNAAQTSYADDIEQSLIDGRVTRAARNAQNADTATAGMLAITLFLLGLILAVHLNVVRVVFLIGATVIGSVAATRLLHTAEQRAPIVSASALATFDRGLALAQDGDCAGAIPEFRAVAGEPGLPEAWRQLGDCIDGLGGAERPAQLYQAVSAYRGAVAADPSDMAAWNNMAFDEMRYGSFDQAGRDLAVALRDPTDVGYPFALSTAAELAALRGDVADASAFADRAIEAIGGRTRSYRALYYDALRDDSAYFEQTKYWTPVVAALYARFQSAEASEDALGSRTPGAASGFTLTDLTAQFQAEPTTHPTGKLTVTVLARASTDGVLSYRAYLYLNGEYYFEPGLSWIRWKWPVTEQSFHEIEPVPATVPGGTLDLELYWNGNLVTSRAVAVS